MLKSATCSVGAAAGWSAACPGRRGRPDGCEHESHLAGACGSSAGASGNSRPRKLACNAVRRPPACHRSCAVHQAEEHPVVCPADALRIGLATSRHGLGRHALSACHHLVVHALGTRKDNASPKRQRCTVLRRSVSAASCSRSTSLSTSSPHASFFHQCRQLKQSCSNLGCILSSPHPFLASGAWCPRTAAGWASTAPLFGVTSRRRGLHQAA